MKRSFVLRVQNDDPGVARSIARALLHPLMERGLRVRVEGETVGGGSEGIAHLTTAARGVRGTSVSLGVFDELDGARWLSPQEVSDEPHEALASILGFLETWGFIGARQSAPATRPASPS